MTEQEGNNDSGKARLHVVISPALLTAIIGAVSTLFAGAYGIADKGLESAQLAKSVRDCETALQRVGELERANITLRQHVDSRTYDRWSGEDQRRHERAIKNRIEDLERAQRRLEALCDAPVGRGGSGKFSSGHRVVD